MLFFLCSMLAGHLRALCWTINGLELLDTPLPGMCTVCLSDNVLWYLGKTLTLLLNCKLYTVEIAILTFTM